MSQLQIDAIVARHVLGVPAPVAPLSSERDQGIIPSRTLGSDAVTAGKGPDMSAPVLLSHAHTNEGQTSSETDQGTTPSIPGNLDTSMARKGPDISASAPLSYTNLTEGQNSREKDRGVTTSVLPKRDSHTTNGGPDLSTVASWRKMIESKSTTSIPLSWLYEKQIDPLPPSQGDDAPILSLPTSDNTVRELLSGVVKQGKTLGPSRNTESSSDSEAMLPASSELLEEPLTPKFPQRDRQKKKVRDLLKQGETLRENVVRLDRSIIFAEHMIKRVTWRPTKQRQFPRDSSFHVPHLLQMTALHNSPLYPIDSSISQVSTALSDEESPAIPSNKSYFQGSPAPGKRRRCHPSRTSACDVEARATKKEAGAGLVSDNPIVS